LSRGIDPSGHTFLEKKYYEMFKGYRVADSSSFFELEKRFTKGALIRKDCDNVFPEDFIALEKVK
jgi:hypothetical protein